MVGNCRPKRRYFYRISGRSDRSRYPKIVENRTHSPDESIVIAITGDGLKTQEALLSRMTEAKIISAKLSEFDRLYEKYGFRFRIADFRNLKLKISDVIFTFM